MPATRAKTFNGTQYGKDAQIVVLAAEGSDGKPYVLKIDESTGKLSVDSSATSTNYALQSLYYRDYSTSNLADTGWGAEVVTLSDALRKLQIFDSSGEFILVSLDGSTEYFRIPPGGIDVDVSSTVFAAGVKIYIKTLSGITANSGALSITATKA
ncbi:hypothetical protein [Caudoviricetes sp.]|nr:hypothetical protein [Caudoviricetes sp.]